MPSPRQLEKWFGVDYGCEPGRHKHASAIYRDRKDSSREAVDSLTYKQFKYGNPLVRLCGNEGTECAAAPSTPSFRTSPAYAKTTATTAIKCLTRAQYGPQPGESVYFGTPEHKTPTSMRCGGFGINAGTILAAPNAIAISVVPPIGQMGAEIWLYENVVRCRMRARAGQSKPSSVADGCNPGKRTPHTRVSTSTSCSFRNSTRRSSSGGSRTQPAQRRWMEHTRCLGVPLRNRLADTARRYTRRAAIHARHGEADHEDQKKCLHGHRLGWKPDTDGVTTRGQSFPAWL